MKRALALLAVLILGFVSSFAVIKGEPNIGCVTPTPSSTIPGLIPYALDFLAIKSITLTTIYTVRNLESQTANVSHQPLTTPDCVLVGNPRSETIHGFAYRNYVLDEYENFPDTFAGEIHIKSDRKITGTAEIVPKLPSMPTATSTRMPTPSSVFMPVVIR